MYINSSKDYDGNPSTGIVFKYDSMTVSYARELTSVSMRYSQGDGFNAFLSRFMYCTYASLVLLLDVSIRDSSCGVCVVIFCGVCVLPRTKVIKIMCGHPII